MTEQRKPLYVQIGEALQADIEGGVYPVGALLPTEQELCQSHGISRHTARAALARLSDAGLVMRRPGAGTRVLARRSAMHCAFEANSIEQLLQYGKTSHLELLDTRLSSASAALAEQLCIPEGAEHLHLTGLRRSGSEGDAVALTEMRLPIHFDTPALALLDPFQAEATLARLLDMSQLSSIDQTFDVDVFNAAQALHMGVTPRTPALRARRRYVDTFGRLLLVATSLHPRERFAHRTVLSRSGY